MAISASQVKELRDKTGAGMMDCKKALTEADGDFDKAVELYSQALTYYEDVDVRKELESLKTMGQLHSISQEWLEPSYGLK